MRKSLFFLILLVSSSSFSNVDDPNEQVIGKVKEFKVDVYHALLDSSTNKVMKGEIQSKYTSRIHYIYDDNFRLKIRYYFSSKGGVYLTYKSFYQTNGSLDSSCSFIRDAQNPNSWKEYIYSAQGQLLVSKSFNKKGKERDTYEYIYAEGGLKISETYLFWAKPSTKEDYFYNKQGWLIKVLKTYLKLENTQTITKMTYDKSGNLLTRKNWNSKGKLSSDVTFKYDENNRIIEECRKAKDEHCSVLHKFKYDEHSNIIEDYNYYENYDSTSVERTRKNSFVYDKNNNWTMKTTFIDDVPLEIVEREIIY
jgi:hypothetical protein